MLEILNEGGPVMWLLFAISLLGTILFLKKAFDLHQAQIRWQDFLRGIFNILKRRNLVEAVAICEETPGPVASITRAAILHFDDPRERVREAMEETGVLEIARLEKNMGLLATIAHVTPAIGLLGTLLSMLRMTHAFQETAPLLHAGNILTTLLYALYPAAAGLAIGIAAFAGYNFLVTRIRSITDDMELAALELLTFLEQKKFTESSSS